MKTSKGEEKMRYKEKNYTREEVYNFLINSRNKQEFVKKLGYKDSRSAKKICQRLNLDLNDLGLVVGKLGAPLVNGQKFGKLTIIEANCDKIAGETASLCLCDCGETTLVKNDFLKRGHTTSCGCKSGHNKNNKIKEGDVFGELTVLQANVELNDHGDQQSLCLCSCGKKIIVRNNCLRKGQYSCGHIQSKGELLIYNILKENNISFEQQFAFKDLRDKKPLLFDFAIFDEEKLIALIEYQGQYHYYKPNFIPQEHFEKGLKHDEQKREYCKQNNIKLIEIPYHDFKKIDYNYLKELIFDE